jgi:IS30 family transposase
VTKPPASIIAVLLAVQCGIARPPRRRAARALTSAVREEISRGLAAKQSTREIASTLHRPASTISREVHRNGGRRHYRAVEADQRARRRAERPKPCRFVREPELRALVAAKLQRNWSPEQVAGWLKCVYPDDTDMQISHETIYRTRYVQAPGALKKELVTHLRQHRPMRRSRRYSTTGQPRGQIIDAVSIAERQSRVVQLIKGDRQGRGDGSARADATRAARTR